MPRLLCLSMALVSSVAIADQKFDPFATSKPPPGRKAPAASSYSGLGTESVTPALIAEFAPKPLDERVARRIQTMLDTRGVGGGRLTSRGDRMVFNSKVTGAQQVWRQDGPMRLAVQLTAGEDPTSAEGITPDDRWIVVSRDLDGEENPGLYLLSIEGGPLRVIHHTPKVKTALQFIADDSKSLVYTANDITADSYAIYRYDLGNDKTELVFDAPGLWSVADHRGTRWLLVKQIGNAQNEIYEYDLGTKALTPLLGQGEVFEFDVAYGAKPGQVLVRTDKLGEFQRLYRLEGGALVPLSPDIKHDVESFAIDEAHARIYYRVNEDGFARLSILDAKTAKPIALPRLPAADNVTLANLTRSGQLTQFTVDSANSVPQTVVYDWRTRKSTTWRVPSTPEIDPTTFAKVTLEPYPARDGTQIPMFVRRPASCAGPCPVIVDFHGGPERQSVAGFNTTAQLFVEAGFVFAQPNVRGSTGYGKGWLQADDGPKRLVVITDIEDAAKFIRTNWTKDGVAPRIGIMGGSYGGYSALMGMTYFAGAYDAGVSDVGISNLVTYLANTAPYRRVLRAAEYGDPVKDKDALTTLSPITHVGKVKAPLLVIQGVNDPRVPVGEAIQIYRELERRRLPGGLMLFADEGHGAAKRSNVVLTIGHTIAFFEKHLKNN